MKVSSPDQKLLLRYELLRARLQICEHQVKFMVREVYENIGQVLSLVRIRLSMIKLDEAYGEKSMVASGDLLGQAIRDLRAACSAFQWDDKWHDPAVLRSVLEQDIRLQQLSTSAPVITVTGKARPLSPDASLISYCTLQNIFEGVKSDGSHFSMKVHYLSNSLLFEMTFQPLATRPLPDGKNKNPPAVHTESIFNSARVMELNDTVELIGGSVGLKQLKGGQYSINMEIPYK
jgi:hypothetical protein